MGVALQPIIGLLLLSATYSFATTPQSIQNVTEINNRDLNKIVRVDTKTETLDPKDKSLINHINTYDQFPIKLGQLDEETAYNESSRALDSSKYWSSEFHSKHNALTLSPLLHVTTTTEGAFEGTRHPSFESNAELTTPTSALFDDKFKETVESVDQKLDNVDLENEEEEDVEPELTIEDLLKNKPENATLDFEKTKAIVNNETIEKNFIHKDVNFEQTKRVNFENAFNETKVYDESEEGAKGEMEVTTIVADVSTRKSAGSKESEEEGTTLHLLSNKIESELDRPAKGSSTTTTTTTMLPDTTVKNKGETESIPVSTTTTPSTPITILTRTNVSDQENFIPLKLGTRKPFSESTFNDISSTTANSKSTEATTLTPIMSDATVTPEMAETTTNSTIEETSSVTDATTEETTLDMGVTMSFIEETTIKTVELESTTVDVNTTPLEVDGTSTMESTTTTTTLGLQEETVKDNEPTTIMISSTTTEELITSTTLLAVSLSESETSETPLPESNVSSSTVGNRVNVRANLTEAITVTVTPSVEVNDLTASIVTTTENDTDISPSDSFTKENDGGDNKGKIAAIAISAVGAVCLVLLAGLLYVMKKRQKRLNYGPRCRPVSLDDYSIDNLSVYNSVRRKGAAARMSKRSFGNPAFDDPVAPSHPLNFAALVKFATNHEDIKAEFEDVPQITAKTSELPEGCDTKNRYANVIPLPETRVYLNFIDGYPNSDYINANYVTGPKNTKGYYIATQGPMHNTVDDFWRMVWEQHAKVILMLTHLVENGLEKCVDYLPESEVLECSRIFGDFQITLKKREVKEKYIISSLQLKNMVSNSWREVTHFWYLGWPEKGVPNEGNSLIAFLIEARSYMKSSTIDKKDVLNGVQNGMGHSEHSPVVVHCSPGTGRTGVTIACDIAIREFETTRLVDIPKIVYRIRRDRANAVQTKEQYNFIYKVVSLYATKLTGGALDNL
ncbi:uncharacterized protein LOC126741104 [Anthonomus grandis grandis]|uniref:uncharacterized protein LOC126741104 n=1 Tax=Anthonomus grandis grandis TaxID=2921223 RepID=UPI002166941A|nr:uncharacterized protein LOC126741104 [Anthonomus grandis grandis]XP_050303390.1 uncharacterized protein LOC126741104 [Anthonomus grandis grandis]XP_050303391.1 uncharacterized protein LOC126741104 [Anthonomus grandis grandis]